jgi:hypothetical protein
MIMSDKNKNKHQHPLQRDSKAIKIFTKVKSKPKGKIINNADKADPRLGEHDDEATHESYLASLNRDAVKFLHISPEVERTDEGFKV